MNQEAGRPRIDDLEAALASVSTAARLGGLLLELRHRAGRSMRELETGSGLPRQAISDLLTGRRFPDEPGLAAFLRACGVPDGRIGPWLAAVARYGTVHTMTGGRPGATPDMTLPLPPELDPDATVNDAVRGGGALHGDSTVVLPGPVQETIAKVRQELLGKVREELRGEVRQKLLAEARQELLTGAREELLESVRKELLVGARKELLAGARQELLAGIREELVAEVREELRTDAPQEPAKAEAHRKSLAEAREELLEGCRQELLADVRGQAAAIISAAERQAQAVLDAAAGRADLTRTAPGWDERTERAEPAGRLGRETGDEAEGNEQAGPRDAHREPEETSLARLLGVAAAGRAGWSAERRPVPVGVDGQGRPTEVVLEEHGLVVGAGNTELLRAVVLGLAMTRPPEALNILLLAEDGLSATAGMDALPQVTARVTVGDANAARLCEALSGELARRREALRAAGDLPSVRDYAKARETDAFLDPLPDLLVVVEDLAATVEGRPGLGELLALIGRTGAALGVHLLAGTERYDEDRLHGVHRHLGNRIALRSASGADTEALLGGPPPERAATGTDAPADAAEGFLKHGTGPATWFRAVSAPGGLLGTLAEELSGHGAEEPYRIWTPTLDETPPLHELLDLLDAADHDHGTGEGLRALLGLVDRPFRHRRDPYWLDLSGDGGNVAVVGRARSGKSTAIRALVTSLALTRGPDEVRFHCVDLGGGALADLDVLPHVAGVTTGFDPERLRRTVKEVWTVLESRERENARGRNDDDTAGDANGGGDRGPDVFLVIDGWPTLLRDFEPVAKTVADLAACGLPYGVHVVASAARWSDFGEDARKLFGSRVELRLPDPDESAVDAERARDVPAGRPGRGLAADGAHFRVATADVEELWKPSASPTAIPLGGTGRPVYADFAEDPHLLIEGSAGPSRTALLRRVTAGITERYAADRAKIVFIDYDRALVDEAGTEHRLGYAATANGAASLVNDIRASMERRLAASGEEAWTGVELFVVVADRDRVAAPEGDPLEPLAGLLPHARRIGLHLVVAAAGGDDAFAAIRPRLRAGRPDPSGRPDRPDRP
ncbi:FtsK/SpoIIIE domain-containing protein [Actinomadura sp. 21ATH]|uniref:FtsK/SpoIIIE domain-containing protein n=1 Tax=Actinomadura sp. 21ATH TaxID=1735444 RepID=UPI0035BFD8EC